MLAFHFLFDLCILDLRVQEPRRSGQQAFILVAHNVSNIGRQAGLQLRITEHFILFSTNSHLQTRLILTSFKLVLVARTSAHLAFLVESHIRNGFVICNAVLSVSFRFSSECTVLLFAILRPVLAIRFNSFEWCEALGALSSFDAV